MKEKFWRLTTKSRGKKNSALVAVAHTILQLAYLVLRTGEPYHDRQTPALSEQQKDRLIRHHVRRLGKLGVRVHSIRSSQEPGFGWHLTMGNYFLPSEPSPIFGHLGAVGETVFSEEANPISEHQAVQVPGGSGPQMLPAPPDSGAADVLVLNCG